MEPYERTRIRRSWRGAVGYREGETPQPLQLSTSNGEELVKETGEKERFG
jgi:hypothetical protein